MMRELKCENLDWKRSHINIEQYTNLQEHSRGGRAAIFIRGAASVDSRGIEGEGQFVWVPHSRCLSQDGGRVVSAVYSPAKTIDLALEATSVAFSVLPREQGRKFRRCDGHVADMASSGPAAQAISTSAEMEASAGRASGDVEGYVPLSRSQQQKRVKKKKG